MGWGVLVATGCAAVEVPVDKHVSYRLPLDEPEERACFERCHPLRASGKEAYAACLAKCPGVAIREFATCRAGEAPPEVECVEVVRRERQRRYTAPAVAAFVAGVFVGAATAVSVTAKERERAVE